MNGRYALAVLALSLLVTQVYGILNVNDALEIAVEYKTSEVEDLGIVPQQEVYHKSTPYWVIEIKRGNEIYAMIPINAETGEVEYKEDVAKEVMKVHLTANFLKSNKGILDFVESKKEAAEGIESEVKDKKSFLDEIKINLPENVSLTSLSAYRNALVTAESAASKVQSAAIEVKQAINPANIKRVDDITAARARISSFVLAQSKLNSDLEKLLKKAEDLRLEAGSKRNEIGEDTYAAIYTATRFSSFDNSRLISWKNDLTEWSAEVDGFFSGIEDKMDDFYAELIRRTPSSNTGKSILEHYLNYTETYNALLANYSQMSAEKQEKMNTLSALLNALYSDYLKGDQEAAEQKYPEIEKFLSEIQKPEETAQECLSGQTRTCGDNGVQECSGGKWGPCIETPPQGLSVNPVLLASIILLILAVVVYKFKDRIFGGEKGEEETVPPYYDLYGK